MSSFMRRHVRLGPAGVIAVIALVLAMTGGAWAAKKVIITSVSQIKPSVRNQLKGEAGPAGPVGAAGKEGATGPAGTPGSNGTSAKVSEFSGVKGGCSAGGVEIQSASPAAYVCNGKDGEPGPFGESLPKGKSLKGNWGVALNSAGAGTDAISFLFPLSTPPVLRVIPEGEEGVVFPTECPGNVTAPKATEGNLCLYVGLATGSLGTIGGVGFGQGVTMTFSGGAAGSIGVGTWAVTAG